MGRHKINLVGIKIDKLTIFKTYEKPDKYCVCKCDCGGEITLLWRTLKKRKYANCGCDLKTFGSIINFDLSGKKLGKLTVLKKIGVNINNERIYLCKCDCGNEKTVAGRDLKRGSVKSCGCLQNRYHDDNPMWQGIGKLGKTTFNRIKLCAKVRNLEFTLTIKELWELYLKQNGKCVLSNLDINFGTSYNNHDQTASLDRIDSNKGYIIDNVQWIHKDINLMKMDLDQKYFIQMCKLIAELDSYSV